jgi:hypothetical protein
MRRRLLLTLLLFVLVIIAMPAFAAKAFKHIAHSY